MFFIYLIAPGLSCGTWILRSAYGMLFCFFFLVAVYRFYFNDQGLNPGPLHWEYGVLTTGPSTKSHSLDFQTQKSISLRQRGLFQTPIKINISRCIKCFPWETKKLHWFDSGRYTSPQLRRACSLAHPLPSPSLLAAVLKSALPSPNLDFYYRSKALSILYWLNQYCSIWLKINK